MSDKTPKSATDEIKALIPALNRNQTIQYLVCERLQRFHFGLGLLAIILSSLIVVTMINPTFKLAFLGGFEPVKLNPAFALAAAIVSSLQTFLGLDVRAEKHQRAGVAYGSIHRFARSRVTGTYTDNENRFALEQILREYTEVSKGSPLTWYRNRRKEAGLNAR